MTENKKPSKVFDSKILQQCYELGYDCGKNGVNDKNCHFTIFSLPEKTKAWELGKRVGEGENKKQ